MSRFLALLLLVCATAVVSVHANLCVKYGKTQCLLHSDECVLCRAFDRLDLCFKENIAKRLPQGTFQCNFPVPPEPPKTTSCDGLSDEAACQAVPHCVWCISAAVPSQCYAEEDAHKLPPAVFQCKFPSVA